MSSGIRRNKLDQMLRNLTDSDKEKLRESIGVDVDRWIVDEAVILELERNVAEYRKALMERPEWKSDSKVPIEGSEFHCDFCDVSGIGAELYYTIADWKTVCIECIELLIERGRGGRE